MIFTLVSRIFVKLAPVAHILSIIIFCNKCHNNNIIMICLIENTVDMSAMETHED